MAMAAVVRSTVRLGPVYTVRIPRARRLCASTQPGKGVVKPLDGIRVLDLTRVLAGPFASMILGDLGAEVIKVEKPGSGDDTRSWGPPFVGKESTYFLSINRNKKSIAVNLKDPKGAKLILELAEVCDILMENYLPGKLGQMGLGYKDVQKVAPRLIYCSISGYGQTGPMSLSPGYDSIASAVSGMMHITGPEDGEPVRPGVAMTDLATGLYTHGAIMAGLLQRQKTGRGLHIDCNLLSSQVACLTHIAANYLNVGKEAKRWGTAHESIVPYQPCPPGPPGGIPMCSQASRDTQSLQCVLSLPWGLLQTDMPKASLISKRASRPKMATLLWLLEIINSSPKYARCLSGDPKFKTNMLRVQNRKELLTILAEKFSEKSTGEWLGKFVGTGVPCGPINNIQRVFSDPQEQGLSQLSKERPQHLPVNKSNKYTTSLMEMCRNMITFCPPNVQLPQ
ncbi:succinate--hydroxymethylglutarate CoA-transferase isoform X3 [Paramormyrops kingsleyae]|uniref:succinate--hydroxymethylglutarate CoA-transferase isoform X3 n=1 Tax=Paramormyrops kingsleyae TaxID=1676925 RepID=UPI000CD5D221|nr:succinate--hydroxymethylglutarate CoA-transferase isoform X3 [Paramormyrops kingsleyae]